MIDLSKLHITELAGLICESLKKAGVKATLSGGACAEIYSKSKYVTGDLDFVVNYLWPQNDKIIDAVMNALGFERQGRIFVNLSVAYSVEFPPGPLSVGEQYLINPVEIKLKHGNLMLLSPTDSVKDRLTSYLYGNDAQCLDQAVMICQINDVDLGDIKEWGKHEGRPERFTEFLNKLEKAKRTRARGKAKGKSQRRNPSANSRMPGAKRPKLPL
jgi:hypothetical protein